MKTINSLKSGLALDTKLSTANEALLLGAQYGGGENIKTGTLHSTCYNATYRTQDGASYYKYRFVEIGGGKYEIDILEQPSYRGRDNRFEVAHRLPSARGGLKICVHEGREPASWEAAKNLAIGWAELTNTYIKTGVTIDEQVIQGLTHFTQAKNAPN